MKSEEKPKHSASISAERIMNMPLDPLYKKFKNLPIPLHKGILAQKITNQQKITTKSGIILPESETSARIDSKLAIISAVGPNCSEYIRIGARVQLNQFVDTYFYHEDEIFFKCDESDVFFIIPSDETSVDNGMKRESVLRREKKLKEQYIGAAWENKHEQNAKDKEKELKKKARKR